MSISELVLATSRSPLASILVKVTVATALTQIVPSTRSANTPKYDVVSIKPCKGEEPLSRARSNVPPNGGFSPGRMHVECSPLVGANGLIRKAYGTFASGVYNAFLHQSALPIEGGPAWIGSEYYTIDAKAEGTPSIEMMHGPMLQLVLEDRFQLRIRRELRDVPVYELTVAKGGAKLKPFDGSCKPVDMSKGSIVSQLEAEGSCPVALRNHRIDAPGQTISDFITFALPFMDRPVIDKTGLHGRFDIYLTLPADDPTGAQDNTSVLAAVMQQQLGLKVVASKAPGTVLVIEHVERPSPDFAAFAASSGRPDGPGATSKR